MSFFKTLRNGDRVSRTKSYALFVDIMHTLSLIGSLRLGAGLYGQLMRLFVSQALLMNRYGVGALVDGPQRVFVAFKSFQRLHRYSADQKEYIRIQYDNGTIEHMPG